MGKPKFAWSYSVINAFKTCPKKYYHERVLKEYPFERNAAAIYGEKVHKAIELYGKNEAPLPKEFLFAKPYVDIARNIKGYKSWEQQFAFTQDMKPCSWFDKETWLRAQIDYLAYNEDRKTVWTIDWKTGNPKNADTKQLELTALAVFATNHKINTVKGGISFVTEGVFVPATYTRDRIEEYWSGWKKELERLEHAYDSGVWNAKQSGLCRQYCPVITCEHNGRS